MSSGVAYLTMRLLMSNKFMLDVDSEPLSLNFPMRPLASFSKASIFSLSAITVNRTVHSVWFSLKSLISGGVLSPPATISSRNCL